MAAVQYFPTATASNWEKCGGIERTRPTWMPMYYAALYHLCRYYAAVHKQVMTWTWRHGPTCVGRPPSVGICSHGSIPSSLYHDVLVGSIPLSSSVVFRFRIPLNNLLPILDDCAWFREEEAAERVSSTGGSELFWYDLSPPNMPPRLHLAFLPKVNEPNFPNFLFFPFIILVR